MNKNIKKLLIKTKRSIFSEQIGNHLSKFKGEGYDFLELREYEPGEDIRNIDWTISAKQQKPYVKVFHTQRELNIKIINCISGSLYFGRAKFKNEILAEISAIIGYSALFQGDNFSSYIINDSLKLDIKKTKRIYDVNRMVENIYNYDLIGKDINYKLIQNELYKKIKEKSIVFIVGDFIKCDNLDLRLLSKKHEVIVLIVRDKFEETPEVINNINLKDPVSHNEFSGDINNKFIKNYTTQIKLNDFELTNKLKQANIKFVKLYTDENILHKLLKFMH